MGLSSQQVQANYARAYLRSLSVVAVFDPFLANDFGSCDLHLDSSQLHPLTNHGHSTSLSLGCDGKVEKRREPPPRLHASGLSDGPHAIVRDLQRPSTMSIGPEALALRTWLCDPTWPGSSTLAAKGPSVFERPTAFALFRRHGGRGRGGGCWGGPLGHLQFGRCRRHVVFWESPSLRGLSFQRRRQHEAETQDR